MSKPKHTFVLKNIDSLEVDLKYNLVSTPLIDTSQPPPETTTITNLAQPHIARASKPILDDHSIVSMETSICSRTLQAAYCFWCRHSFTTPPIGCPVTYHPKQSSKLCTSEITKEKYITHHNIPFYETHDVHDTVAHYETDGVFCSFNCCLAFIQDQQHDARYIASRELLYHYYITTQHTKQQLHPAPHWRLLQDYGGNLTIDEFRKSFSANTFTPKDLTISTYPQVYPIGHIYEKNYIF